MIEILQKLNRYQKAALASNADSKLKSRIAYYENPNICKHCGKLMEVPLNRRASHTKRQKYCSRACVGASKSISHPKAVKVKIIKPEKYAYLLLVTKKDLFDKRGIYYRYRSTIRKHAHYVYNKEIDSHNCTICGYEKHIQVCHIKSVASFPNDTLISVINDITNLIGLCPNNHWEFDNGFITLN